MISKQLAICFTLLFIKGSMQHDIVELRRNESAQLGSQEQVNQEYRPIIQYNFAVSPESLPDLIPDNPPIASGPPGKMGAQGEPGPKGEQGLPGKKGEAGPQAQCDLAAINEFQQRLLNTINEKFAMILCPALPTVVDDNIEVDVGHAAIVGTTAHYSCKNGFMLRGASSTTCLSKGGEVAWTDFVPGVPQCVECDGLAIGSSCYFVGPTYSSNSKSAADQLCKDTKDSSHLAYIKNHNEYTKIREYVNSNKIRKAMAWGANTLTIILGGLYNSNTKMVTWEIGRATSELQSHSDLVCRLLLEKKKNNNKKKHKKMKKAKRKNNAKAH